MTTDTHPLFSLDACLTAFGLGDVPLGHTIGAHIFWSALNALECYGKEYDPSQTIVWSPVEFGNHVLFEIACHREERNHPQVVAVRFCAFPQRDMVPKKCIQKDGSIPMCVIWDILRTWYVRRFDKQDTLGVLEALEITFARVGTVLKEARLCISERDLERAWGKYRPLPIVFEQLRLW